MKIGDTCPVCEKGSLAPATYSMKLVHRGHEIEVGGLTAWLCDECSERTLDPTQIRANNVMVASAKREHADAQRPKELLDSLQIREIRAMLGLTQADASKIFRGGANAFSKYERGEIIQSEAMDLLLRLARDVPAATEWLYVRAGLVPTVVAQTGITVVGSSSWDKSFGGFWVQTHLPLSYPIDFPIVADNDDTDFSPEWRTQAPVRMAAGGC